MWIRRVLRGLLAACVIGWVVLLGLIWVAGGIGQGLFPESPVLTFVTYRNGGQADYWLAVLDLRGDKLLLRPQPGEALVVARDAGGAPAIVAVRYKQTQIVLTVFDPARGSQRLLTTDAGSGSSWSSDGRYYAFESRNRHWTIELVDTLSGQRTTIPGGLGNDRLPVWWP